MGARKILYCLGILSAAMIIIIQIPSRAACETASKVFLKNIQPQGKWIDAREHNSYYAAFGSLIKDSEGLHLFFAGSGKDYVEGEWPEWQKDTPYSTDRIYYSKSTDGGRTWSKAIPIIQAAKDPQTGKEIRAQGACANSVVYFNGYYYLYFESYNPPSYMIAIHAARSRNISGPYEIWTDDGTGHGHWSRTDINPSRPGSTTEAWKPVIKPKLLRFPNGEKYAKDVLPLSRNQSYWNDYYGTGIVSGAMVKDNQIYLFYIDTTYDAYTDSKGAILFPYSLGYNCYEYGPDGRLVLHDPARPFQIYPVSLMCTSADGVTFDGNDEKALWDLSANWRLWNVSAFVYSPQDRYFIAFSAKELGNILSSRTSADGINWGPATVLANLAHSYKGHPRIAVNPSGQINADGYASPSLSDTYLYLGRNYLLQNRILLSDYHYYEGGFNLYGFKLGLTTDPSQAITGDILETPQTPPIGFDQKAVYITETNRYANYSGQGSGFYAAGTGFKDNVYAEVRWINPHDPSGKLGISVWYTKNSSTHRITSWHSDPVPVGERHDYYPERYCVFIPVSAAIQDLFNQGWQAFFTLYNADTGRSATVNMTPAGRKMSPPTLIRSLDTGGELIFQGMGIGLPGFPSSESWASLSWLRGDGTRIWPAYYFLDNGTVNGIRKGVDPVTKLRYVAIPLNAGWRSLLSSQRTNVILTIGEGNENNNKLVRVSYDRVTTATAPGAPTIGTATAGNRRATVTFTPGSTGGSPILDYTVTSSPGGFTATGAASPLTVNGVINGISYSFTVTARNAQGTGPASAASNSVIPGPPAAPSNLTATP